MFSERPFQTKQNKLGRNMMQTRSIRMSHRTHTLTLTQKHTQPQKHETTCENTQAYMHAKHIKILI